MAGLPASKTALLVEKRKQPCSKTKRPLHGCCYMGKLPLFGFCFHFDFAVFLFKVTEQVYNFLKQRAEIHAGPLCFSQ